MKQSNNGSSRSIKVVTARKPACAGSSAARSGKVVALKSNKGSAIRAVCNSDIRAIENQRPIMAHLADGRIKLLAAMQAFEALMSVYDDVAKAYSQEALDLADKKSRLSPADLDDYVLVTFGPKWNVELAIDSLSIATAAVNIQSTTMEQQRVMCESYLAVHNCIHEMSALQVDRLRRES